MGTVKAAKAAARHLREGGTRPREASSAALQAVGIKKHKKHREGKRGRQESIDDDERDAPEAKLARLAATSTRVYAGVEGGGGACMLLHDVSSCMYARQEGG
jgi:hypothetical protein